MMDMIIRVVAITLAVLASGSARADTDVCQTIRDAIAKLNAANQFQQKGIITYIDTGKSYSLDYLVSGDKEYSRKDSGSWKVGVRQAVPLIVDGKPAVYECSRAGTERLGDVSTVIYTYKRLTPDHGVRDVRIWVDESTEKPLQTDMSFETASDRRARFTFSYNPQAALPMVDGQ
ncbi:hypothetical protein [Rhizobium sp. RCAM05973]|uniref:hypothetical protein n=1 Tax=Rhizobium sp. RCAM05973 TaxID=2994066 RepID=UPI0022EBD3D3|nr:hypothetical protein [Rhizobium sp. RCAM05973]